MFVYDPNSLPFFSFPNAGASNVNDSGGFTGAFIWNRGTPGLGEGNLGLSGSRSMTESWTMTPIIDPVKLQLMRCAYQQVVANCGIGEMSMNCPDCELMRTAYMGKIPRGASCREKYATDASQCPCVVAEAEAVPEGESQRVMEAPGTPEGQQADEGAPMAAAPAAAGDATASTSTPATHSSPSFPGAVDTDCLYARCWIGYGCKKCMRKCKGCVKMGQYCGMYIWILPGGQDELTKLTLNILNYSYNDPTPVRTKSVQWELDVSGAGNGTQPSGDAYCCPAAKTGAAATASAPGAPDKTQSPSSARKVTITATLPFNEPVVPYCGNNTCNQPAIHNVFERPDLFYGPSTPSAIPGAGYLQFQQNQLNLTPQAR